MRFGVLALQNAPWAELVERWRHLDEIGIETIWVADHLARSGNPWFECWSCLTALAYETANVRIGPLVTSMTLRNPAVLAQTAATVNELSGGRLELGIGSGASENDHELARVRQWEPKERAQLFVEWTEHLVGTLADDRLRQDPPIPLTIAGHGPTTLRLAAGHANRWNAFGGFGMSAEDGLAKCRRDNQRLDGFCADTGRTVLRSALVGYPFIAETPWRSEQAWTDFVGRWEDAGFEELVLFYPWDWQMPAGSVERGLAERMLGKG